MAPTQSGQGRHVYIVGAGIAGMTAALSLARARFQVTLFERNGRVGGKFGAGVGAHRRGARARLSLPRSPVVNFWGLVEEIGLSKEDELILRAWASGSCGRSRRNNPSPSVYRRSGSTASGRISPGPSRAA